MSKKIAKTGINDDPLTASRRDEDDGESDVEGLEYTELMSRHRKKVEFYPFFPIFFSLSLSLKYNFARILEPGLSYSN